MKTTWLSKAARAVGQAVSSVKSWRPKLMVWKH